MVRPSGLQASPFEIIMSSSTGASSRFDDRRYNRALLASRCSFMLPAQNRPCASARPSLKRGCAGSYGAAAILRSSVPCRSTNQIPSRSAATNPPPARKAKHPIACGIGHALLVPREGSKRLSEGALMSIQYSACSSTDHTGHSPRLALTSSTHAKEDSMGGIPYAASAVLRDRDAHRTRKRCARCEHAGARIATFAGAVECIGHVGHGFKREKRPSLGLVRGHEHDQVVASSVGGNFHGELGCRPANGRWRPPACKAVIERGGANGTRRVEIPLRRERSTPRRAARAIGVPDSARRETKLGLSIATEIGMPSQAEGKRAAAGIFDVEPELEGDGQRIGNEGEPLPRAIRKWPFACPCAGCILLELDRETRGPASCHVPRPLPAVAVNRGRLDVDLTPQAVFAASP